MVHNITTLYGDKLGASDGEIGHVNDFYFDDRSWAVRYLVADTGAWLPGRLVLLSPHSFGGLYQPGKLLLVKLTRAQIENSPSIDTHKPISRQYEEDYYRYYGWPYYWHGEGLWGMSGFPILDHHPTHELPKESSSKGDPSHERASAHLRSTKAVSGYHIKAKDGTLGQVSDFIMDYRNWSISHLVIRIGNRFSGKEVQVQTSKVDHISYEESAVHMRITMDAIERSPEHSPALAATAT